MFARFDARMVRCRPRAGHLWTRMPLLLRTQGFGWQLPPSDAPATRSTVGHDAQRRPDTSRHHCRFRRQGLVAMPQGRRPPMAGDRQGASQRGDRLPVLHKPARLAYQLPGHASAHHRGTMASRPQRPPLSRRRPGRFRSVGVVAVLGKQGPRVAGASPIANGVETDWLPVLHGTEGVGHELVGEARARCRTGMARTERRPYPARRDRRLPQDRVVEVFAQPGPRVAREHQASDTRPCWLPLLRKPEDFHHQLARGHSPGTRPAVGRRAERRRDAARRYGRLGAPCLVAV